MTNIACESQIQINGKTLLVVFVTVASVASVASVVTDFAAESQIITVLNMDSSTRKHDVQGVSLSDVCTSRMSRNLVASIAAKMSTKLLPDCHYQASFARR